MASRGMTQFQGQQPRGENTGKELREYSVARALAGPRLFRGERRLNKSEFELAVPQDVATRDLGVAVFVQELASMKILAASAVPVKVSRPGKD